MDYSENRRPQRSSSSSSSGDQTRSRLEFFKVFLPNFSSNQLLIPPDFVKQIKIRGREFPEKAILKDHNGEEWNVNLFEKANRWFIKEGWEDFVNSWSLEFGDFLIFRYFRKKLLFSVKVFARNGCLKEDVFSETSDNEEETEVTGTADKAPEVVVLGSEDDEEEEEVVRGGERRRRPVRDCKRKYDHLNLENLKKSKGTSSFNNMKSGVLLQPLVEETESVKCVMPKHPHYVVDIQKNTSKQLFLPNTFLKRHNIQLKPQVILYDEKGIQWPMKIERRYESLRAIVTTGWSEFWRNNLKVGDYCVLEFVLDEENTCGEIRGQVCGPGLKTHRCHRYLVVVP